MSVTTESPRTNGVDTAALFATLDAVKGQNEIAKFQFRATNEWLDGTHSRSRYSDFHGAMQEMQHRHETVVDSDHVVRRRTADVQGRTVADLAHRPSASSFSTASATSAATSSGVLPSVSTCTAATAR